MLLFNTFDKKNLIKVGKASIGFLKGLMNMTFKDGFCWFLFLNLE